MPDLLCFTRQAVLLARIKEAHPPLQPARNVLDDFSGVQRAHDVFDAFQVMEVEAFCGVHDMIHAAILSYGSHASLREVMP